MSGNPRYRSGHALQGQGLQKHPLVFVIPAPAIVTPFGSTWAKIQLLHGLVIRLLPHIKGMPSTFTLVCTKGSRRWVLTALGIHWYVCFAASSETHSFIPIFFCRFVGCQPFWFPVAPEHLLMLTRGNGHPPGWSSPYG